MIRLLSVDTCPYSSVTTFQQPQLYNFMYCTFLMTPFSSPKTTLFGGKLCLATATVQAHQNEINSIPGSFSPDELSENSKRSNYIFRNLSSAKISKLTVLLVVCSYCCALSAAVKSSHTRCSQQQLPDHAAKSEGKVSFP